MQDEEYLFATKVTSNDVLLLFFKGEKGERRGRLYIITGFL